MHQGHLEAAEEGEMRRRICQQYWFMFPDKEQLCPPPPPPPIT